MPLPTTAEDFVKYAENRPISAHNDVKKHNITIARLFKNPYQFLALAEVSRDAASELIKRRPTRIAGLFSNVEQLHDLGLFHPNMLRQLIEKRFKIIARLFTNSAEAVSFAHSFHRTFSRLATLQPKHMGKLFKTLESAKSLGNGYSIRYLPASFIQHSRSDAGDNIVIVGLGPAGLAAAIEAGKHAPFNSKIVLLTDRETYDRKEIFRLDAEVMDYLRDRVFDLERYRYHVSAGHLYTVNSIQDRAHIGPPSRFTVIQTQRIEHMLHEQLSTMRDRVEIIHVPKGSDPNINAASHELILEDDRRIKFKFLMGADGAHHRTADVLTRQGIQIQYRDRQAEQTHAFHAIGCYSFRSPPFNAHEYAVTLGTHRRNSRAPAEVTAEMDTMGWPLSSSPEYRIFAIESLYIGAEAPQTLATDARAISNWLQTILRLHLPDHMMAPLSMERTSEGVEACRIFEVKLREADRVIYDLPELADGHEAYFLQAGEALRSTHYQTGSGAGTAFLIAREWGRLLRTDMSPVNLHDFKVAVERLLADNRSRVDEYLFARRQREERAQLGLSLAEYSSNPSSFFAGLPTLRRVDSEYEYESEYESESESEYESESESEYESVSDSRRRYRQAVLYGR